MEWDIGLVCIDVTDGMVVSLIIGAAGLFRVICIGSCLLNEILMECDIDCVCIG